MGKLSGQHEYWNVHESPRSGRLDPTTEKVAWDDVKLIRTYIRAQKKTAAASGRTPPSIARAVLTSIWETPRIGFHLEARKSFTAEVDFRNKLLWAPWSIEAARQWNLTKSAKNLVLEHVTPIDWMWRQLTKLHDDFEDPTSAFHADPEWESASHLRHKWKHHAAAYLDRYWTVATLTAEQASAIDYYGGRTVGYEPNPFERYRIAEKAMDQARASGKAVPEFSTAKFVIPGHANDLAR